MKLVLTVINNDDSRAAITALTGQNFFVTQLSTTGGFLMVGNTTLLIGTSEERLPELKGILKTYCKTRVKSSPSSETFGRSMLNHSVEEEVTVGGAVIFVLSVDEFERL
ncbi:MAG: cyclic-di-AMP receptor [Clostridia bacterium]|nr:cyclic-di-AMP receptor [Clostridia bacterium]